mmetsp:Transcript_143309/g.445465  ORF Transcript_143309/g.445465 Transcript_143309/m.445465 type:complete len:469 (-) Transcript_143309:162-1568(-)
MPSPIPWVLLLLPLVPCGASFHKGLIFDKRIPRRQANGALQTLALDGCLSSAETAVPLSLLQVNALSKRMRAGASNQTGKRIPLHSVQVAASASGGPRAKLAVQTRAAARSASPSDPAQPQQQQNSIPLAAAFSPGEPMKVAALQASRTAASTQGDALQGLVFTVIVLIIVVGLYLLVVKDYFPGGDFDAVLSSDGAGKRSLQPNAQSLLARRTLASGLTTGPLTDPRSSMVPRQDPRTSMVPRPSADEWNAELPMIYPQLVMPVAHTRLAVPVEHLGRPQFEVDVLGLSGVPLLCAALVQGPGSCDIQISLHSVSTLVAVITSGLEIVGADGLFIGKIVKESRPMETLKYVLQDRASRPILALAGFNTDGRDFKLTSTSGGRVVERATAVRRPRGGKLPAEHYEIVANPNVDAVLVLACFLAVAVFDPASGVNGSTFRVPDAPSGRPSTAPRLESQSLVGLYDSYQQ